MSNAGIEPIFQDMLEAAAPTVVVASFRRSGTHLTIDSLINNASDVHSAYLNLETLNPAHKEHVSDAAFVEQLNRERRKSVIVKTHFGPSLKSNGSMWLEHAATLIARSRVLYVVRDPRDVMISLRKFNSSYNPTYRDKSMSEHLDRQLPLWRDHVSYWHERNVPVVRFEDWAQSYERTLDRCLRDLDLTLADRPIVCLYQYGQKNPRKSRWQKIPVLGRLLAGTERSVATTAKLPGSGTVGGWRDVLTPDDKKKVADICGPWLERLGYEV